MSGNTYIWAGWHKLIQADKRLSPWEFARSLIIHPGNRQFTCICKKNVLHGICLLQQMLCLQKVFKQVNLEDKSVLCQAANRRPQFICTCNNKAIHRFRMFLRESERFENTFEVVESLQRCWITLKETEDSELYASTCIPSCMTIDHWPGWIKNPNIQWRIQKNWSSEFKILNS